MTQTRKQVPFGIIGLIVAIGIVYGDIGTSPLYVMQAIYDGLPKAYLNANAIIGALSCIIWTLTLQTTVKYVIITLRANNKGEGGIMSLFALIRKKYRWAYIIAAIGAATLLADGVITPSITVISAIEGVHGVLSVVPIIPVTIAILLVLFLIQPFGTAWLGKYFGSIMLIWFSMLATLGIIGFLQYPEIAKAFNPIYAFRFLREVPSAYVILGAVFLATTGAEALYSDLGHCGMNNIRVSWIFVKSSLILNYLGQGAWILTHASSMSGSVNPFFAMMPTWFSPFGVLMATLAAIIASQAMISGSYTIISEAISMDIWPNIYIKYPTEVKGQMYIPMVNYILLTLCLAIVLAFRSSNNMEAAYGLSITITMLMTTMLLFLYFRMQHISLWISITITAFFLTVETNFLIANLNKFAHGGFATIIIAGIIFVFMYVWYNGRRIKNRAVTYQPIKSTIPVLEEISTDTTIPKFATHLVYVTRAKYPNEIERKVIYSLIHLLPKRADTYWFVYLSRSDEPYEFSYTVKTFSQQKIFRIDINAGFKLGIHIDKYIRQIALEMEEKGMVSLASRYPSLYNHHIGGDFRFVVVERILQGDTKLPPVKKTILSFYYFMKRFSTSDTQILGLDPTSVTVESVPLFSVMPDEQ
ncbi:KUP/HAK/KT family potassium transporter [Microbacter margulisiae]|uniref:Probable potassium transport system protein Kup n=1 Tax=Microbacter margulisiae TaxID=1350067 RepID=A0A7W5DT82_9PORP|nr:KUP/HAK/KT family potassium transporter [Microbacter margulisiae]MBB3188325.1 KUP system potassium uptake protein [Microbacter margulisiae]